jgi:hypothetical protein
MICPNCKCEYIRGVTQCADCDVPLVDKLEPELAKPPGDIRWVGIWWGNDSDERDRVKDALETAGILAAEFDPKTYISFFPSEQTMEIRVPYPDEERARKIVFEAQGCVDPGELTPEEIQSLALSESERPDREEEPSQLQELPEHWFKDWPVAEVWSGGSEGMADTLIACFREIGIPSHTISNSGRWSLVVPQGRESRAKEIVREVVEAVPPE